MSFITQYALALDAVFQQRVMQAMITAATNVQAEDVETANHTNRANYAKLVLNAPQAYLLAFAQAIAANPAITGSSTDSDIQFSANSLWNAMAGTII